jgi:hypothetical protein
VSVVVAVHAGVGQGEGVDEGVALDEGDGPTVGLGEEEGPDVGDENPLVLPSGSVAVAVRWGPVNETPFAKSNTPLLSAIACPS